VLRSVVVEVSSRIEVSLHVLQLGRYPEEHLHEMVQ